MKRKTFLKKPEIKKEKVIKFIKTQVIDLGIATLICLTLLGYIPVHVILVLALIGFIRYVIRLVKRVRKNIAKEKHT